MKQKTNKNFIQLINLLSEGYILKEDIQKALGVKSATFYKYLKLIKNAGFLMEREGQSYKIKNFTNSLVLDFYEHSIFAYLGYLSYFMLSHKKNKILEYAIDKMLLLSKKEDYLKYKENYNLYKMISTKEDYREKIDTIQKFIDTSSKIVITLSNKKIIYVNPVEFIYDKEKVYLYVFDTKNSQKEKISLKNIVKVEFQKEDKTKNENETIFELYGRLAKSYLLKDRERIIDNFSDRIVIANSSGDKKALFKRLLRYDTLCKILHPANDVIAFKNLIRKSLDNINKFQDNIYIEI